MIGAMEIIDRAYAKGSEFVGALLLVAITAIILLQIVARSIVGNALIWPEELSVFLHIYLVFIGAAYNARLDSHIKISFFADRMPAHLRFIVTLAALLLVLMHLVILLWAMVPMSDALRISRSPALEWPMLMFFAVIPLAAALMLLFFGLMTARLIRDWVGRLGAKDDPR